MSNFNMENDMSYLADTNEDERVAFLKVLVRLAKIDGNIDSEEKDFIKNLGMIFQVPSDRYDEIKNVGNDEDVIKAVKAIRSRKTALELIKEMCLLANSDSDLSDKETLLIGKVGQAMGVELEKIEQISQWVIDRIIWLEEGKIIFEKV